MPLLHYVASPLIADNIARGTGYIKEIIDPAQDARALKLNNDHCKPVEHRLFPFCREKFEV